MAEGKEVKTKDKQEPVIDLQAVRNDAAREEKERVRELIAYGEQFDRQKEASEAIDNGVSVDAFRKFVLDNLPETEVVDTDGDLGMSEKEVQRFSFLRAINAQANPNDRKVQEAAAFELEASRAFAEKTKRQPQGIFVPPDVLKRDLVVGTDSAGGYTVATDLLAANFIDILRNKMMVNQAGATTLSGLVGDVAIPKQTGGATAYWVAESGAVTESQQTFAQVTLAPKTVGAYTDMSRKLLIQSSVDIETLVKRDLATKLAIAIDAAALHGSGSSNQPTGIASTTGIGSVAGGTNGAAPDWDDIVDLESEVAVDNADIGSLAYMTNAKVRGKLKKTLVTATYGDVMVWPVNATSINGYPVYVTNQVSSTLTKGTSSGVCSAIFFGNWADLLIGMWSGLDLLVDPYTGGTSGTVRVVALQDMDIAVRHAESFAAMLDALTA